jgi:hypothetical protein
MVFRILVAGRGLAILSLLLYVLAMSIAVPTALAKNPDCTIDIEGDPGDGVLQPGPTYVYNPQPVPDSSSTESIFVVTLLFLGDNKFLPVFQMSDFSGHPVFQLEHRTIRDWRWHRAP